MKYAIGIDPGQHTGVATWDLEAQGFADLRTADFWGAYEYVCGTFDPACAVVVVEDPALNRPVWHYDAEGARRRERVARNVGMNQRDAALLMDGLRRRGYRVIAVRPQAAKWDAVTFARMLRRRVRTNQHERDAARLVIGLSVAACAAIGPAAPPRAPLPV